MKRIHVFIDGFNVYDFISDFQNKSFFGISSSVYSWCVRDLCSHKGSPTPLNAFKEGEKKEIVAALLLFPLLKNPPPSHPFRLLHLLLVGRPQNRSGIRNSLTRSDLVLGRRLVQRVVQSACLEDD